MTSHNIIFIPETSLVSTVVPKINIPISQKQFTSEIDLGNPCSNESSRVSSRPASQGHLPSRWLSYPIPKADHVMARLLLFCPNKAYPSFPV